MPSFEKLDFSRPLSKFTTTKWKPKKGKYRVSVGNIQGWENLSPEFSESAIPDCRKVQILYRQGVGSFYCNSPKSEYLKVAGATKPQEKIPFVLIFWPTDSNGQLDKDRLKNGEFEVKYYPMSADKYNQLIEIHSEGSLALYDIKISVLDEQYHKMNFVACRESLYQTISKKDDSLFKSIASEVKDVYDGVWTDIAQDLTLEEIREKLSGEVGSPIGDNAGFSSSSIDADDILDDVLG